MSRIRLTWNNASTTIVEQRVYRSTAPLDIDDMPEPLAVLPRRSREYLDSAIVDGLTYYYAVSSVLPDYSELISEQIRVEATPEESDPHWDKVVALLHFDGNLTDETGRVWSGSAAYAESPLNGFGQALYKHSGNIGEIPQSNFGSDLNNTRVFTIEAQVSMSMVAGPTSYPGIITKRNLGVQQDDFSLLVSGGHANVLVFEFTDGSGVKTIFGTTSLSISEMHHVAVSSDGSVVRLFLNGKLESSGVISSDILNRAYPVRIGNLDATVGTLYAWSGLIDEVRITKGVARYTEDFTPPTKPFPNN